MEIHIIYTYKKEQRHNKYTIDTNVLKDKETFKADILSRLNEYSQDQLLMASVCLSCDDKDVPQWFLDCDGKFVFSSPILDFISKNLIVDRFPVSKEIKEGGIHSSCKVVINVSDEFYLGNSEEIMNEGKLNYYFPMGESKDMGLASIFGALHVLHQIYTWHPEWKVLIHCQAGANRSPTIKAAFHFMMLGEHLPEKKENGLILKPNQLLWNCEKGHLPELQKMESFLLNCKKAFDNPDKFFGGMFDWVMRKSFRKVNKKDLD